MSKTRQGWVRHTLGFALMTFLIFGMLTLLSRFAPSHTQNVQFMQAAAVATDTPTPAPTDTPIPPTATPVPPSTPTSVPVTQLVFDSASGSSQHTLDSTAYYLSLRFHTQPAMPGYVASYGATACGTALFSTTGSHLDATGAQSVTMTFRASCPPPFAVTVTAQFLGSGSSTYPLTGSTTFTISN